MREDEVRAWMRAKNLKDSTITTQMSKMRKLERYFGDLDQHIVNGTIDKVTEQVANTATLPAELGNQGERNHLKQSLRYYREFASSNGQTVEKSQFDLLNLERLKQAFLALHPDFVNFTDCPSFAASEGDYKHALVVEASRLVRENVDESDAKLGRALIELLAGRTTLECNLIDWRAQKVVDNATVTNPGFLEAAVGKLIRTENTLDGIVAFVETAWPIMRGDPPTNPYAESRMFPTMLCALVHPQIVLPIRSTPTDNAFRMLMGRPAFAYAPLSREELVNVCAMAREIMRIMDEEWHWAPRDFWDVQGFIWKTCQKRLSDPNNQTSDTGIASSEGNSVIMQPKNLILYGPPGTGKTYRTAYEAVTLCDGAADYSDDALGRKALMHRYRELVEARQIEFVTFHQSLSYEEFIEGLRPDTVEGGGANGGFSLKPESGIFKRIVERALKPVVQGDAMFSLENRRIFKMSLGQSDDAHSTWVFDESLEEGFALLGFKDVDWSDKRFSNRDEILSELEVRFPDERVTPQMGVVKSPDRFRNQLSVGDVVIASKGLNAFRAIGVVEGNYEYAPREHGRYSHRRKMRWLWNDPDGLPVEELSPGTRFSLETIYELPRGRLNLPVVDRLVNSVDGVIDGPSPSGELLPHVLIIDEINRANISKVFGELITLIEPDKRLGMSGALTVRLPYSKREFGVPANLHIIGTMNTADRSIALLDTALRRRFTFKELMPDHTMLEEAAFRTGMNLPAILKSLNDRIEFLFDREHQIGHAYFMACNSPTDVDDVMRFKIIPLLAEYFYEDWSKVALVLGDADGAGNFIQRIKLTPPGGLHIEGFGDERYRWMVRDQFLASAYDQFG